MITFIEKYFKSLVVLLLVIVCLSLYTARNNGRYAGVSGGRSEGCYVLDTKTSKLWLRSLGVSIYLGTNDKAKKKLISPTPQAP